MALAAALFLYPIFSRIRRRWGITSETCLCVGTSAVEVVPSTCNAAVIERAEQLSIELGDVVTCQSRYQGRMLGIDAATVLDRSHYLSAELVRFARGLNDTPKIAALLLLAPGLGNSGCRAIVGVVIAIGGVLSARRVAETMSQKITSMNHGQGFTANVITSLIVIGASRLGLPVSTTHVRCGSLFKIGTVTRQAHWNMIAKTLLAWLVKLPLGAILGAVCYVCVARFS